MDEKAWCDLFVLLRHNLEIIQSWEPAFPDSGALRCEQSRHRTLAHLRACQEQWLFVVEAFIDRDAPSVKILHPWRQFQVGNYATLPWDVHLQKFAADRKRWMSFRDSVDWTRGGNRNQKPDTIGDLTLHLATHESHHIGKTNGGNRLPDTPDALVGFIKAIRFETLMGQNGSVQVPDGRRAIESK